MSDDKIAEIRARHSRDDRWRNLPSMICPQAHDDRALLLAEIERLNKDLATQQGCCDGAAAQDAHVRQEREEHRAEVDRLRAEIKRLRAENEKQRADVERLRADRRERIATAALQGMLSNPHNSQWEPQDYFRAAVYYADGLIAEFDKEEGKP